MAKRFWLMALAIGAGAVGLWVALGPGEEEVTVQGAVDGGRRSHNGPAGASAAVVARALDAGVPSLAEPGPETAAAYPLDLGALQRAMPDNVYWAFGAPTSDERVLEARKEAARKRNETFGRIQAGEAEEEEIHAYFEAQRRLHQDYLELSNRILSEHADELPERDRGLYELGAGMHRDRLAELPRLEAEAIARKRDQDERRRAWEVSGKPLPSPTPLPQIPP